MNLSAAYFINNDAVFLAKDLLGKHIVRIRNNQITKTIITETEAYHGEKDLACHARFGKTARNQVMYQQGGIWYVYLCYGIHWMLNIVTGEANFPSAVLIRGIGNIHGPGKVTKHLEVNKDFNGTYILAQSNLYIEDTDIVPKDIETTTRIGITYAGEWAKKPWRFILHDNV